MKRPPYTMYALYAAFLFWTSICCCFDSDNLLRFTKMVKCLPEFEYFYCFLENRNFMSKIRRSKVTNYAALK